MSEKLSERLIGLGKDLEVAGFYIQAHVKSVEKIKKLENEVKQYKGRFEDTDRLMQKFEIEKIKLNKIACDAIERADVAEAGLRFIYKEYGKEKNENLTKDALWLKIASLEAEKESIILPEGVPEEFKAFIESMATEYNRHRLKQGDSWKTMSAEELWVALYWDGIHSKHMVNYQTTAQYPDHLLDIANFCWLLWNRLKEEEQVLSLDGKS